MILNRLAAIVVAFALLFNAPVPSLAGTKKGDQLVKDGRRAEAAKEYDKALDLYEQALASDPLDPAYQLAANRVRFQAGQIHLSRGKTLRGQGNLEEALKEFQKSYAIDPSSTVAEQEMRRTIKLIDEQKKKPEGGKEEEKPQDFNVSPAQLAREKSEERAASILGVPELKPLTPVITNLRIVNQSPKVLFETIGKLAGVNVLFDSAFSDGGKRYSVELARTTLGEALDYAAILSKTFWKPLSPNAIFITEDSVAKRRDYEEHVTRVFYLQNITTPQELQEMMTTIRQVTDIRKVFPYNSQSALVMRGTADQMALAEKVILDLDKPKPEVVVDVLVFEASRTKTRELGIAFSSGGLAIPVTFTPGGNVPTPAPAASGSAGSITLNQLKNLGGNDWSVVLPSATINALLSDGSTRVLQAPQVRATDGQKASLRLGDRYPYATGSFQPGVGSVGVSPLVSTQFQFADVGVNVDVTPRIHGTDEVSMQVELEVSNIRERINVGGLEQPVIGQRKVSHIIRVKEGQATLIGGLMGGTDRVTRTGIPGLMQIPGLGHLFSSEKTEVSNNDLLVVLMPHIVRYPDITPANLAAVASGTETIFRVSYAPRIGDTPAAAQPAKPETAPAATPAPGIVLPGQITPPVQMPAPAEAKPEASPEAAPAAPAPPLGGAAPPPAPSPAQPKIALLSSSLEPALNSQVLVRVNVENVQELFAAPMKLTYDSKVLRLVEIRRGPFLAGDGAQITFNETRVDSPGMAIIGANRIAGSGGISGSGTLAVLVFQAVGRGPTKLAFEELTLRDAKLQPINVEAPSLNFDVK